MASKLLPAWVYKYQWSDPQTGLLGQMALNFLQQLWAASPTAPSASGVPANEFYAGPASGEDADPDFRLLVTSDLPSALFRSSTVAALPMAGVGEAIFCTDLGGGAGLLTGDGSNWRRTSPGLETQATAAALSLVVLVNAEEQFQPANLAANMVVTLSGTNAYAGARFRWIRAGGGAFTLEIVDGVSTNVLYTSGSGANTTIESVFDGSNWQLAQHSTL